MLYKPSDTDRIVPYANCIFRLRKKSSKYCRDKTDREQECRKGCIVFKRTDSIKEMLHYV